MEQQMRARARLQAAAIPTNRGRSILGFHWHAGDGPGGAAPSPALALPYWFWGGLCAAFSGVVLLGGSWYFLRGARQAAAASHGLATRRSPAAASRPASTSTPKGR